jgi:hypothetical protein
LPAPAATASSLATCSSSSTPNSTTVPGWKPATANPPPKSGSPSSSVPLASPPHSPRRPDRRQRLPRGRLHRCRPPLRPPLRTRSPARRACRSHQARPAAYTPAAPLVTAPVTPRIKVDQGR